MVPNYMSLYIYSWSRPYSHGEEALFVMVIALSCYTVDVAVDNITIYALYVDVMD